jgi:hypothetical protein
MHVLHARCPHVEVGDATSLLVCAGTCARACLNPTHSHTPCQPCTNTHCMYVCLNFASPRPTLDLQRQPVPGVPMHAATGAAGKYTSASLRRSPGAERRALDAKSALRAPPKPKGERERRDPLASPSYERHVLTLTLHHCTVLLYAVTCALHVGAFRH